MVHSRDSLRSKRFRLVSEQRKTEEVGILGFGRARNEMSAKNETFACAILTLVPRSLLLNRAETLTARATVEMSDYSSITISFHYVSVGDSSDNQGQEKVPTERNTY